MSEAKTKACNLNEDEIKALIMYHARETINETDYSLERMNYLNKRLKAFSEPEKVEEKKATETNFVAPVWPGAST